MLKRNLLLKISLLSLLLVAAFSHAQLSELSQGYYVDRQVSAPEVIQSALDAEPQQGDAYQLFSHGKPGELLLEGQWLGKEAIVDFL